VVNFKPECTIRFIEKWSVLWAGSSIILFVIGLWFSLWASPGDYLQGETVRIMYVHVPASWGALGCYAVMALLAGYGLIKRTPMSFIAIQAIAPVGFCFCLISLMTGAIWGKPTWGTWWVWDARLTSMFLLALLYLGYFMLAYMNDVDGSSNFSSAILLLIGSLNLPIIKWSVTWWNTLHQPASVLKWGKPAIHTAMLTPLFIMASAFFVLSIWLVLYRLRTLLLHKRWLHLLLKG
jgi:heme exporter protein C